MAEKMVQQIGLAHPGLAGQEEARSPLGPGAHTAQGQQLPQGGLLDLLRQVAGRDIPGRRQHNQPLNDVLQLPDIVRPVAIPEGPQNFTP